MTQSLAQVSLQIKKKKKKKYSHCSIHYHDVNQVPINQTVHQKKKKKKIYSQSLFITEIANKGRTQNVVCCVDTVYIQTIVPGCTHTEILHRMNICSFCRGPFIAKLKLHQIHQVSTENNLTLWNSNKFFLYWHKTTQVIFIKVTHLWGFMNCTIKLTTSTEDMSIRGHI